MHANLVRAPCFKLTAHKRRARKMLQRIYMRHSPLGVFLRHSHFFAVGRVPAYGLVHRYRLGDISQRHGIIYTAHGMFLYLLGKREVRLVVLCDDEQSARVFIYAVNYPRACRAAYTRERIAAMCHQRIDERAVVISCRGMNNHALRLIDDDDIAVLIDDIERYFLGFHLIWGCRRNFRLHRVALADLVFLLRRFSVYRDGAALDELLRIGARYPLGGGNKNIEPPAARFLRYGELTHLFLRSLPRLPPLFRLFPLLPFSYRGKIPYL